LLLAKIIITITLGVHKTQRMTLNQPLIAPNSHKNPMQHSQKGTLVVSLYFPPKKQKTEHQSESNSVTSWPSNLWKAYPCHTTSPHQPVLKLLA
jgi:hypothetical protein